MTPFFVCRFSPPERHEGIVFVCVVGQQRQGRAPIAVSYVNSVRKIYVLIEKNTFLAKNFVSLFAFFEAVAEKFTDKEIT